MLQHQVKETGLQFKQLLCALDFSLVADRFQVHGYLGKKPETEHHQWSDKVK